MASASQIPFRNLAGGSHTPDAPRHPPAPAPVGGGLRPAPSGAAVRCDARIRADLCGRPSPGERSRKEFPPFSGFHLRRKESKSSLLAACTSAKILLTQRSVAAKGGGTRAECHRPGIAGAGLFRRNCSAISATPLTQRRVDEDPPQWGGSSSAPKRSVRPLRLRRRGLMPSCRTSNGCPARGLSSLKGSPGTFQRYSAMTSISQRSFFGSSRTATQERAGLPVKYSP